MDYVESDLMLMFSLRLAFMVLDEFSEILKRFLKFLVEILKMEDIFDDDNNNDIFSIILFFDDGV